MNENASSYRCIHCLQEYRTNPCTYRKSEGGKTTKQPHGVSCTWGSQSVWWETPVCQCWQRWPGQTSAAPHTHGIPLSEKSATHTPGVSLSQKTSVHTTRSSDSENTLVLCVGLFFNINGCPILFSMKCMWYSKHTILGIWTCSNKQTN